MQAVHTVTFELEKDVVEEQLDLWLQVCDGGWLGNDFVCILCIGTSVGEKLV